MIFFRILSVFLVITVASFICNASVIRTGDEEKINEIDARVETHVDVDEFRRRPGSIGGGGGSGSAYKVTSNIYFMIVLFFFLLLK